MLSNKTKNPKTNKNKCKCCQFVALLKSVVCRETFLLRNACTHIFVCVCVYLDIWVVTPLPPNFGEMKIFVLLGLFGHLPDASEQECGCKVPSREVYFFCQVNWTEKYAEM